MAFSGDTEEVVLTVNGIKKVSSPTSDKTCGLTGTVRI